MAIFNGQPIYNGTPPIPITYPTANLNDNTYINSREVTKWSETDAPWTLLLVSSSTASIPYEAYTNIPFTDYTYNSNIPSKNQFINLITDNTMITAPSTGIYDIRAGICLYLGGNANALGSMFTYITINNVIKLQGNETGANNNAYPRATLSNLFFLNRGDQIKVTVLSLFVTSSGVAFAPNLTGDPTAIFLSIRYLGKR